MTKGTNQTYPEDCSKIDISLVFSLRSKALPGSQTENKQRSQLSPSRVSPGHTPPSPPVLVIPRKCISQTKYIKAQCTN